MKFSTLFIGLVFLLPSLLSAASGNRFLEARKLSSGEVILVAEGEKEPRSTGSYSIRIYGGGNAKFPFDDFKGGVIRGRDGSVVKMILIQLNGNQTPELVVILQSAGSGSCLLAEAFSLTVKTPKLIASIQGLPSQSDPLAKIKEKLSQTSF